MHPYMSWCPRGSHISIRRRWSRRSRAYRRRASIVGPGIGGMPPVMIRSGSPAAWQSVVWMTRAYRIPNHSLLSRGFPHSTAGALRQGEPDPTAKHFAE